MVPEIGDAKEGNMRLERIQTPPAYQVREGFRRQGTNGILEDRAIELDPEQNRARQQPHYGQSSEQNDQGKSEAEIDTPPGTGEDSPPHLDIVV